MLTASWGALYRCYSEPFASNARRGKKSNIKMERIFSIKMADVLVFWLFWVGFFQMNQVG